MSNFKSIAWNDLQDDFKDPEFAYEFGEGVRDFYRKQGAEAKQKRIIKLLEDRRRRTSDKYAGLANWEHRLIGIAIEETLSECIALIKGEK